MCVKRDLSFVLCFEKKKKSIDLKVSSTEIVRRKWRKFKMIAPALQCLWFKHSSIYFMLFAILWIKNCRIIDFRVQDTIFQLLSLVWKSSLLWLTWKRGKSDTLSGNVYIWDTVLGKNKTEFIEVQFDILYEKKVEVIEENLFDDDLHCFHEKKRNTKLSSILFFPHQWNIFPWKRNLH